MQISLVPINCRLGNKSWNLLTCDISRAFENLEVKLSVEPPVWEDIDEYPDIFYILERGYPYFSIGVTSRTLSKKDPRYKTRQVFGEATSEPPYAMIRSNSHFSPRYKIMHLAQTAVHETLHMIGLDHHQKRVHSPNFLLCPMMPSSGVYETSLRPCKKCYSHFEKFLRKESA